ncbi:transcriptional regulator ATRX-like isoform X2 [Toxorhynchites rutilus septentrionalis]|uniref:transcriptional regulator ATRX-like isoform X2 n=1 Tax=Toxorhynchites rutilus septentrionalis TaxID=329112 RepID=UPI00247A243F|nr:transcriptional regulator ATRX-like isoform X2 [Toxorhynchites rutilus septentrionalis]
MATVVEEPDLFNGLEITEMDEINMENGDEYVFIPSDNENEDENGTGGDHASLASQSVFHRLVPPAAFPAVSMGCETKANETISNDPVSMMNNAGAHFLIKETTIVNNIDLTQDNQDGTTDERFSVNYDFNLDTQELFNVGHSKDNASMMDAEPQAVVDVNLREGLAMIKDEIEIEEAVVNFPDDEEVGLSELSQLVVHDAHHNLGSEVITLDSDVAESEDEQDSVLLSLIEQSPTIVAKERADDDKSPVENDHAYTSLPSPKDVLETGLESLKTISRSLLGEASSSVADAQETLKSIASIEEQVRSLKRRVLSQQCEEAAEATQALEATENLSPPEPPVPPPPLSETNLLPPQQSSCDADNLSVLLSDNCSEQLECDSITELVAVNSDEASERVDDALEQLIQIHGIREHSGTESDDSMDKQSTENLSRHLSPNRSEPLEHTGLPMECEQTDGSRSAENHTEESTDEHPNPMPEQDDNDVVAGSNNHSPESIAQSEKDGRFPKINSLDDLIHYGELFSKECEVWLDKINNNKRPIAEQADSANDTEQMMSILATNVQKLSIKLLKVVPEGVTVSSRNRVEASVQTEKVKLTAEKAKALNEKYKKRLLSSLGEAEAADSDSYDSDVSYASGSDDVGGDATVNMDDDDDDDEAFERRQHRRKSNRLKKIEEQKSLESHPTKDDSELAKSNEDAASESTIVMTRKRNVRRLVSTDSAPTEENNEQTEEDASEADLTQFLVPKSPVLSVVASTNDNVSVGNEPVSSETDCDSVGKPRIIRTDSVDYSHDGGSVAEPMENDEYDSVRVIKHESSLNLSASENVSSTTEKKLSQEEDGAVEAMQTEDAEEQTDSELLDDVLPQVDDILLDVDDILPAAEGVVQDYLVEEEVRSEEEPKQVASQKEQQQTWSDAKKPKRAEKKIENTEEDTETDKDEDEREKMLEDMTESELEEYYDNLREKEVDKLCNLSNLEVTRNAYPQKAQEVKRKPVVVKKKERIIDDILNNAEFHPISDDSESDTEVLETEEMFLQKCNENMKDQLLNQLSSSDTDQDTVSEDSVIEALKRDRDYDSDDSAGSILMEKFFKSLNKDHGQSGDEQEREKKIGDDGEEPLKEDSEVDKKKENSTDFIDDSEVLDVDEEGKEKSEIRIKSSDRRIDAAGQKEKPKDATLNKTTAIDPIDKQLFSKKMFREVDETLRKDREHDVFGKENGSVTDRSERIASEDSDVELLDVSMFQSKRKMKEKKLEDFDFSVATKRATPQLKRKDTKEDCISLSSESEAEAVEETNNETEEKENKQRKIRAMLTQDELTDETKTAQKDEELRVSRLRKKNEQLKKLMTTFKPGPDESNLVLDYDVKTGKVICVHPEIEKLLKPHQREGVKFMYDNSYGSIDYINKHPGSGCILAHCMGLGKTLQLITLLHSVMRYPQLKTKRVLVICPKSTVMNWSDEIQHWLGSLKSGPRLKVFYFPDNSDVNDKLKVLSDWYSSTASRCGCMLIGYEAFRILVNYEKRKRTPSNILAAKAAFVKKKVDEYLLNPGADLVICDEGHQIKNKKSAISGAVSQIKTRRRIVLTGTPIQNNLKEYYCMVNFIKPLFLGSDREFNNLYANPIKNGQHKDSDSRAIKIMKQRSYVLHNKLSRFVQRREAGVLKEFLPEKFEYVLFVPLTPVQEKMYEVFLQMNEYTTPTGDGIGENARSKKFKLLADYTSLRKIWTHPKVLEKAWETAVQEKNKRDARFRHTSTPDSDDDRPDDYNDISSGALSVTNDWWRRHLAANDLESLYPSNKLRIMFEVLKQCQERGEKCLIFSAFVAVLNVVEHFMAKINNRENDPIADLYGYGNLKGPWEPGKDYYRLDGKTQKNIRHKMITSFNDPSNKRTKCFLISAKAGGQGINLIGANRVIILDTSWNPSNDQQNIFRIFRLGQKRKCYVYRLLAMGTMEEKVYSRSVTKQAMSFRVVDEQQVDRHYSFSELAELYNLAKVADQVRETPILPADDLLASLLRNHPDCVFKYHEHDSLLENKPEQDLSEDDKKEAWAAYEREIQNNEKPSYLGSLGGLMPNFLGPGFPGAPGSGIGPYPSLAYPGLPSALADMYRSDFGYGSSMNRLMYPYGNQPYPMISDPSYSSIMGKSPYTNFNLPGSSSGLPDYGLSPSMNGPGPTGTTGYSSTVALQSLLDLYAKSMSGAMGSSTVTTATSTSISPSASTTAAPIPPYNALGSLKQFNGFPQIPPGSTAIPHSSPQLPPPASPQSANTSSGNAALINMLNEQPMPMSSAASSGPFSHLNSPLPAPSIPLPRAAPSTTATMALPSPVLTTSPAAKPVASPTTASTVSQTIMKSSVSKSGDNSGNPKPVSLTTTIVASDDDDVDDDGIPRPHIIVRDPSSINATSVKPNDDDNVVKKINMGIVYPEEKKKNQSKDIMLSAKSITTLAKPTIAVKSMDSMKAVPSSLSNVSKMSSPVHMVSRPGLSGSAGNRPIRASPVQAHPQNTQRPSPQSRQNQSFSSSSTTPSPTVISKSSLTRQQVPVITSAKSMQISTVNSQSTSTGSTNLQQRSVIPPPANSNVTATSTTPAGSPLPRGAIAAQQLRELQQRMNLGGSSASNTSSHQVVARASKSTSQVMINRPGGAISKQPTTGVLASSTSTLMANQKQQQRTTPISAGANQNNSVVKIAKAATSLSDSVSITKITSTGQRIAMSNPSINSTSSISSPINRNALISSSLGRKQDLIITKTIPGTATVRKVVPGPNMIVKSQVTPSAVGPKRQFPPLSSVVKKTTANPGMHPTITTSISGGSLPLSGSSSITVRKRKAEPTLIDSLKAKNNAITISEVRSIYQPPAAKKPSQGTPIQPQKRLGSGITITPRKPNPQQQQQNVLEVVEIE